MKNFKKTALAASVLALSLGGVGSVQAGAYAVSYTGISGGVLDMLQPSLAGGCSLIGAQNGAAALAGVSTCGVGTTVVNFSNPSSNTSGSSATLTGVPGAIFSVGPQSGLVDADPANLGGYVGVANNTYSKVGMVGSNAVRGDSNLVSEQAGILALDALGRTTTDPGFTLTSSIATNTIAETSLTGDAQSTGQGNVASGSLMTINFELAAPGQVLFSFEADPYLEVALDADARPGSVARGILNTTITITPQGGGFPSFIWNPDGVLGTGIFGGTEFSDPTTLNTNLEQQVAGGSNIYNPTGDGIGGATAGLFTALTSGLAAGQYVLNVSNTSRVEATNVPEPGTVGLMGLAIAGLGFASRRRKAK